MDPPRWKTYQDFALTFERLEGRRYRARAEGPGGATSSTFSLPFDEKEIEIFLLKVGRPRRGVTRGRVPRPMRETREFGEKLYDAVMQGDVRDLFSSARQMAIREDTGLRIRLRMNEAPDLADLPWEFLYDGRDFLALSDTTPLVRFLDLPNPPRALQVELPLRVLITISAPHDQPPIDVIAEQEKIQEALSGLETKGRLEVVYTHDASLQSLQRTLRRARSQGRPFHVWHFIGHGVFDPAQRTSTLLFQDEHQLSSPVGGFELGTLFSTYPQLRIAVLNACEGARADREDPFAGVAMALVERGVPAVVGMQFEISDSAAIAFAGEFYAALLDGLPLDAAITEARRAVFFLPNFVEWATPVLFLRAPDGQIFDIPAAEGERARPTPEPEPDRNLAARLESLYTAGLSAFWLEEWDEAIRNFQAVQSLNPNYRDASERLEQVRRQAEWASRYQEAQQALDAEDWRAAVATLETLSEQAPGYRDVQALLREAQRNHRLADLYTQAQRLVEAGSWQAALNVFAEIESLAPDFDDPEGLRGTAQRELDQERRRQAAERDYRQALEAMDTGDWTAALRALESALSHDPTFEDAHRLQRRARQEIEREAAEAKTPTAQEPDQRPPEPEGTPVEPQPQTAGRPPAPSRRTATAELRPQAGVSQIWDTVVEFWQDLYQPGAAREGTAPIAGPLPERDLRFVLWTALVWTVAATILFSISRYVFWQPGILSLSFADWRVQEMTYRILTDGGMGLGLGLSLAALLDRSYAPYRGRAPYPQFALIWAVAAALNYPTWGMFFSHFFEVNLGLWWMITLTGLVGLIGGWLTVRPLGRSRTEPGREGTAVPAFAWAGGLALGAAVVLQMGGLWHGNEAISRGVQFGVAGLLGAWGTVGWVLARPGRVPWRKILIGGAGFLLIEFLTRSLQT